MGRKSAAKNRSTTTTGSPSEPRRSSLPLIAAVVALIVVIGGVLYYRSSSAASTTAALDVPQRPPVSDDMKPHPQANLPPLQFPSYPMQRSPDVVTAAYKFAAEHPEVLSYVPCYCGCEHGHRGNEDCFVKSRDVNGDVVEWEDHGMECAVCLDVATRARVLYSQGVSVEDIRATVEKEWANRSSAHTPTPQAPHHH